LSKHRFPRTVRCTTSRFAPHHKPLRALGVAELNLVTGGVDPAPAPTSGNPPTSGSPILPRRTNQEQTGAEAAHT
jgi:hypothetical protein